MTDRNGWISTDNQHPPKNGSLLIIARHIDGFSTEISWDMHDEIWVGDGGFPASLDEFSWWTQIKHPAIVEDSDRAFQIMKEALNANKN